MNAEQKKIALECIRLWGSEDLSDCAGDQMAALLQDLVDAPEPEPVDELKGFEMFFDQHIKVLAEKHPVKLVRQLAQLVRAKQSAPTPAEAPADVARDAARYRWLLNQAWFQQAADRFDFTDGGMQIRFEKCMDEFIDATMSEKGQS